MASYTFNYQQTMAEQKEIESAATELNTKCAKTMAEIKESLNAAWTGDSAKAFMQFLENARVDLENQSKELKQLSDYIATSANQLKQMEAENASRTSNI